MLLLEAMLLLEDPVQSFRLANVEADEHRM